MQPGLGGGDVGHDLMNRLLWKDLRCEYEAKGEKVVAAAMGQSVQTHLAAYSRWCGDDVVDEAFAKAEQRLGSATASADSRSERC